MAGIEDTHPRVRQPDQGTVAALSAGEVLLPDFVRREAGGVSVVPDVPGRGLQMQRFVDRVFAAGSCFVGLDYAAFDAMLYGEEGRAAGNAPVRIAAAIAAFPPERRELYKAPKANQDSTVEYLFGPVWLEASVEVPIFGEDGEDGQPQVTGYETQRRQTPTRMDVDEFVAAMWQQGVRSGLDMAAVRAAIESAQGERVVIARRREPQAGTDATVQEQTQALHRDDSPAILPSGRIDLGQFKNHFPQVAEGTRLLQKLPRRLGLPGRDIDGSVLEPALPRDFELEDLAGPGTRVERTAKGEFLVAARDGFLNFDAKSHEVAVTEKIINREGVSQRTTGNLFLVGEHYEEHGEVQEHRIVEGKHMTFHADVFGSVVSHGGEVHLRANLAGGSLHNQEGGSLRVDGHVSRATIDARGCEVCAGQVEGSRIVGGRVQLGRAVACDIVAEEVVIDEAISCSIAARRIQIRRSVARRDVECLVTLCLPDFTELDKRRVAETKAAEELRAKVGARQAELDALLVQPDLRNYLAAEQRIRAGGVTLSAAQEAQWRQATQRLARPLHEVEYLRQQLDKLGWQLAIHDEALAALEREREQGGAGIACEIRQVAGLTAVQTFAIPPGEPVLAGIELKKLGRTLRDSHRVRQRLFSGESGRYAWIPPKAD